MCSDRELAMNPEIGSTILLVRKESTTLLAKKWIVTNRTSTSAGGLLILGGKDIGNNQSVSIRTLLVSRWQTALSRAEKAIYHPPEKPASIRDILP